MTFRYVRKRNRSSFQKSFFFFTPNKNNTDWQRPILYLYVPIVPDAIFLTHSIIYMSSWKEKRAILYGSFIHRSEFLFSPWHIICMYIYFICIVWISLINRLQKFAPFGVQSTEPFIAMCRSSYIWTKGSTWAYMFQI